MIFFKRKMGLTYTILGALFQILAIIFGVLAYKADNATDKIQPVNSTTINVNGDYVGGDKKTNIKNESVPKKNKLKDENLINFKQETKPNKENIMEQNQDEKSKNNNTPTVNNGIINTGVNNGNQIVNNYNGVEPPRQINAQDISYLKNNIPLDYKIDFDFVNSTQESIDYSEQIFKEIQKNGYSVNEVTAIGNLQDGRPIKKGDRFIIYKNENTKTAKIVIKEQK